MSMYLYCGYSYDLSTDNVVCVLVHSARLGHLPHIPEPFPNRSRLNNLIRRGCLVWNHRESDVVLVRWPEVDMVRSLEFLHGAIGRKRGFVSTGLLTQKRE